MKTLYSTFASLMMLACATVSAQDIKLPAANLNRAKMTVSAALAGRHSTREFSTQNLSLQDLSELCWAANGVSRDGSFRTAPSAMNRQEIMLLVFCESGVYEYDAKANMLLQKAQGDHRELLVSNGGGGFTQDFVLQAPVSLVMVIDLEKLGGNSQQSLMMGCVDAGNVSENINIFCEGAGLVTVPRATMDVAKIKTLVGLTDNQIPVMNNPVGYPVKGKK